MPSIYDLKPKFQNLLRPVCRKLEAAGVTANAVTLTACGMSLAAGGLVAAFPNAAWPVLLYPVVLFVRMALNAIDGMLAREFGQKSRLGAILNETTDVLSDAALAVPLLLRPEFGVWPVIAFAFFAVLTEYVGVVSLMVGSPRQYAGPMGKSDRAFLIGLLALLAGLGLLAKVWADGVLLVAAALAVLTCLNRARAALKAGA